MPITREFSASGTIGFMWLTREGEWGPDTEDYYIYPITLNGIYYPPMDISGLKPYVGAGLAIVHEERDYDSYHYGYWTSTDSTSVGGNIMAGLALPFSKTGSITFEVQYLFFDTGVREDTSESGVNLSVEMKYGF